MVAVFGSYIYRIQVYSLVRQKDEIRQYHNHPINNNHTRPSIVDHKTSESLKEILGKHKYKLRSFIIYWNEIREWRIMEYDEESKYRPQYEFDVAAHKRGRWF